MSSLSPSEALAGSGDLTVAVGGMNLYGTLVVNANGTPLVTTNNQGQLAGKILAAMLSAAGTLSITVSKATSVSNALSFTIVASGGNALPSVTGITPSSIALSAAQLASAGSISITVTANGTTTAPTSFNVVSTGNPVPTVTSITPCTMTRPMAPPGLTITGTGFVSGAKVFIGGADVSLTGGTPTVTSPTRIQLNGLPFTVTQNAGSCSLVVQNPTPGGGASNADVLFTVQ